MERKGGSNKEISSHRELTEYRACENKLTAIISFPPTVRWREKKREMKKVPGKRSGHKKFTRGLYGGFARYTTSMKAEEKTPFINLKKRYREIGSLLSILSIGTKKKIKKKSERKRVARVENSKSRQRNHVLPRNKGQARRENRK